MFSMFESHNVDPIELLTEKFGTPKKVMDEGKERDTWETPYGVSFSQPFPSMWFYYYDPSIGYIQKGCELGAMFGGDVKMAIEQLEADPEKLRRKPECIAYLERLTGKTAFRKHNQFGKWHLVGDGYSMFNNPFGLSLGYTRGENDFEIWYKRHEEEPRESQTVAQIEETLKEYNLI